MAPELRELRYRYDDPGYYGIVATEITSSRMARRNGLTNSIRVSERALPKLMEAARIAMQRLRVTNDMTLFAFASPDLRAHCSTDSTTSSVCIFISSAIITNLTPAEWMFVIGHELGHQALGHAVYPWQEMGGSDLRALELQRAAEISADRAGLIACGDIDVALRATLKLVSGLTEAHVDIDVGEYSQQLAELRDGVGGDHAFRATHPPFPARVRALLRFDSVLKEVAAGGDHAPLLDEVDKSILEELESVAAGAGDHPYMDRSRTAAFWCVARKMCSEGAFTAQDQARMAAVFGGERVASLKRLLIASSSKAQALELIEEKAQVAEQDLKVSPVVVQRAFEQIMRGFA